MTAHHSINLFRYKIPSKPCAFNKRIVLEKSFKAIALVVCPVGMTESCE